MKIIILHSCFVLLFLVPTKILKVTNIEGEKNEYQIRSHRVIIRL